MKAVLLGQYAEPGAELHVRTNLDNLKQTGSITDYHKQFREICAKAVLSPVRCAEATYARMRGLQPHIKRECAVDPQTSTAYTDLDRLVNCAKAFDALAMPFAHEIWNATKVDAGTAKRHFERPGYHAHGDVAGKRARQTTDPVHYCPNVSLRRGRNSVCLRTQQTPIKAAQAWQPFEHSC